MAENGIIKIGKKGVLTFQIGDGPEFSVDVVARSNEWSDIYREFLGPDGNIDPARAKEQCLAAMEFVEDISGAKQGTYSMAEILEFMNVLQEKKNELSFFFKPKSLGEPSSPKPSEGSIASDFLPSRRTVFGDASEG